MEVGLHHAPLFDRTFAIERSSQSVGNRALYLRLDLLWIDGMAAIDRKHQAMHFDQPIGANGHLGHCGRVAAIAHELSDAPMYAGWQGFTPTCLERHRIEHRAVFRMIAHHAAAKLNGIDFCCPRQFLHEAFHVHRILIGVDAAPRTHRHMRIAHGIFNSQIGHGIAKLRIAGFLIPTLQLPLVLAIGHETGTDERIDRLPGQTHLQGKQLTARAQPR